MCDDALSRLAPETLVLPDREALDTFLSLADARDRVKRASFEDVFFTFKRIGLADSLDLLPLVTPRQARGIIDLDCWRKDSFATKPFMEWIAAFVQAGPEETVRALSGMDETVIALFLKDVVNVYEVERDEPLPGTNLMFSPDQRFAAEPMEDAEPEPVSVAFMILDALFRFHPPLGYQVLTLVRYTTRLELEETAYENRNGRLEIHGFVDYYDAMTIYAAPDPSELRGAPSREREVPLVPGEEETTGLPAIFVEVLRDAPGNLLMQAFSGVGVSDQERIGQELTALANRVISANLVDFGDIGSVRDCLEEMRDTLAIGVEALSQKPGGPAGILRSHYLQSLFRAGFARIADLRNRVEALTAIPGFRPSLLETQELEMLAALRQFRPQRYVDGQRVRFATLDEVRRTMQTVQELSDAIDYCLRSIPARSGTDSMTLRQWFNSAALRFQMDGVFEAGPVQADRLHRHFQGGYRSPDVEVTEAVREFARRCLGEMREELEPVAGGPLDPRFIRTVPLI